MSGFYNNYQCVSMHRTCGRGLHGIYSDDRRLRKHARRFLAWYINRSKEHPASIKIVKDNRGDTVMLIKGTYHDGWDVRTAIKVICRRGKDKCTDLFPNLYDENDVINYGITFDGEHICKWGDIYSSVKFQRDGIPNNYDREAELYDDYCFEKNRKAYRINHDSSIDWRKTYRDEIIKEAQSYAETINIISRYEKLPEYFRKNWEWLYKHLFEYKDISNFNYVLGCKNGLLWYHDELQIKVLNECRYSKNTPKQNSRQLLALGIIA